VISANNADNLGKIVKQSNEFARNKLCARNLMAARILACLASTLREDDVDFRELGILAKSVLGHTGGSDYRELNAACEKLSDYVLEQKDDDGEIQKYAIFSAIRYEDGVIFAKFHPDLKPFFLGLKSNFMEYDLQEFLRLPGIYSQKLFEYLKSWDDCVERTEDIETVHAMLDIPEYARRNFKEFRCRVLDKAHRDILRLTSLRYEWEAIKRGTGKTSPVTGIRFIFSPGGQARSRKAGKEARDKKIRDERNRLFLESAKCFESNSGCETPKKHGKCALCFRIRGLEPPAFLKNRLPEYE